MKYLKIYETAAYKHKWQKDVELKDFDNLEYEEEEDEPINISPFPNLKFGKDGKKYKCGDRIIVINRTGRPAYEPQIDGKIGTIITSYIDVDHRDNYLICFDDAVFNGRPYRKYNVPDKHGSWVHSHELKIISLL